ncbi:hypothetical protein A1OW_13020 [Enterovibrio norvegicus]|uniref:hypothetical protein n=1 Tax=Enterovibrio norvegicus TaxID=188144 RepID=UPI0003043522|nr:hypothetical protein [Enterovibrio norvegicus]OEF49333.1 hypothetical protein A1OW_13020 [Enterovibrio norvegicus]
MAKPFPWGMSRTGGKPFEFDFWHCQSAMQPGLHQRNYQCLSDRHRAKLDVNESDLNGASQRPSFLSEHTLGLTLNSFSVRGRLTRVMDHAVTLAPVFAKATRRQPQYDHQQNSKKGVAMLTKHQAATAQYVKSLAC